MKSVEIERKTICLDENYLKKMNKFLKKHDGNFSAGIRKLIELGNYLSDVIELDEVDEATFKDICRRNEWIVSGKAVLVPFPLFLWLLDRSIGEFPSIKIIKEIGYDAWGDKALNVQNIPLIEFVRMIKELLQEFGWPVDIKIIRNTMCQEEENKLHIEISSSDTYVIQVTAVFLTLHLYMRGLSLTNIEELSQKTILEFSCPERNELRGIFLRHFGQNQEFFQAIEENMPFWKNMVEIYKSNDYNLAVTTISVLEDILINNDPQQIAEIKRTFKLLFNEEINEISLEKFLEKLKGFCRVTKLLKRVEWGNDEIVMYHEYKDRRAINCIKEILLSLFGDKIEKFELEELEGRFRLVQK